MDLLPLTWRSTRRMYSRSTSASGMIWLVAAAGTCRSMKESSKPAVRTLSGRLSGPMTLVGESVAADSTTFSSSRTLPGQ